MYVGRDEGVLVGFGVSPKSVGMELMGRLDGAPVGFILGALEVGFTVGRAEGTAFGCLLGRRDGSVNG